MARTRGLIATGTRGRRGMTLLQLVVVMASSITAGFVVIVLVFGARHTDCHVSQARQVNEQSRALQCWARDNDGCFPLPSAFDRKNATIVADGATKNTSGNIFSILAFNRLVSVYELVDRYEMGNIRPDEDFEFRTPQAAATPECALWDPAFNADFTGAAPGNLSWAHRIPTDAESGGWSNALSSSTPIVSTRGAKMAGIGGTAQEPEAIWADPSSLHLRKSGGRLIWEGAVAYGDGHVTHETSVFVSGPRMNPASLPDAIFLDEPGAEHVGNDYLSIFTTAGAARRDFTAIWD